MSIVVSTLEPPCSDSCGIRENPGTCQGQTLPEVLKDVFTDIRIPPIRSSSIHALEHCPRKFMYQSKFGLRPKAYSSALSMGRIFHLTLQALFTGADKEQAMKAANNELHRRTNEIMASGDAMGFTQDGQLITKVLQKMEDDYGKARAMAFAFMSYSPFDWNEWEILETPDGTPCVELKLEAKIKGISVPLISPCDLALVKKSTGDVWIIDHKTTSMSTRARARSVRISSQIALYRLVLQCHLDSWAETGQGEYPQRKVVGSVHNIVQKPTIKFCPKTKDKSGYDHYIQRVKDWYQEKHKADPKESPIFQTYTMFTAPVLNKELYLRLQQQARASRTDPCLDRFYRAGDYACHSFNAECPFSELCSSDAVMWEEIVGRRFETKHREDEEAEEENE